MLGTMPDIRLGIIQGRMLEIMLGMLAEIMQEIMLENAGNNNRILARDNAGDRGETNRARSARSVTAPLNSNKFLSD